MLTRSPDLLSIHEIQEAQTQRRKNQAAEVACFYGLDLTSVTRALWAQIARTKRIPLDFSNEEPNEESLQAIRETQEMIASGKGERYSTAEELFEALDLQQH